MAYTITEKQANHYFYSTMDHPGYCRECKEIDDGAYVEPDAREYTCPCCETNNLFGLEEAVLMGLVVIGA
tara:strand:+ start:867 stop:1076 length:210 start_codon:yes stop_codon:yes gene_type:complete